MTVTMHRGSTSLAIKTGWFFLLVMDVEVVRPDPKDAEFLKAKDSLIQFLGLQKKFTECNFPEFSKRGLIANELLMHMPIEQMKKFIHFSDILRGRPNFTEEDFQEILLANSCNDIVLS